MKRKRKNEKGVVLVWFYLIIGSIIATSSSLYGISLQETRLLRVDDALDKAFYLAEAGIDVKLAELRVNNFANIAQRPLGEGTYSATYCSPTTTLCVDNVGTIENEALQSRVLATGAVDGRSRIIDVVVHRPPPRGVRGAISAQGNVTINGNTIYDGRDHDINGALTGDAGTFGVSSTGTVTLAPGSNAEIGGTGIAPSNPATPDVQYKNGADDKGHLLPHEILGVPASYLEQFKTPTPPVTPFNGIYYLTSGWDNPKFGSSNNPSTGILIIHNDASDAQIQNIKGSFKGIIIADNVVNFKGGGGGADILGAVHFNSLTDDNSGGNNPARVKYSSAVLTDPNIVSTSQYSVASWQDRQNE